MKKTVLSFKKAKREGEKIAVLTAYDYTIAKLMDQSGVDAILVGDSLGMVTLGYQDTLPVTMQDMIHHTRAVARGVENAFLITDMPFMSYQCSVQDAVRNAGRLIKEGRAQAVKLEGGEEIGDQIRAIVRASIPVMGHVGLTPQSVNAMGGFKVQGKAEEEARRVLKAAQAVEAAGAFAMVLECIPEKLAALISRKVSIPTIGIGAGKGCDGQVLVWQDMLGMNPDFTPKFVKRFAEGGRLMREAVEAYCAEVKGSSFPGPEHGFGIADDVIDKLY